MLVQAESCLVTLPKPVLTVMPKLEYRGLSRCEQMSNGDGARSRGHGHAARVQAVA